MEKHDTRMKMIHGDRVYATFYVFACACACFRGDKKGQDILQAEHMTAIMFGHMTLQNHGLYMNINTLLSNIFFGNISTTMHAGP